ncbi:MAG: hypothetical protein NVSMB9_27800 [Isosphaeraceae bacterium]
MFWPIWVFLAAVAALGQWMALRHLGPEARNGGLAVSAMGLSVLYAIAVGAAAFAGERENRTLAFLDTLPVSRRDLWGGKVSFAIGSTLLLGAGLLALAMSAGTEKWQIEEGMGAAVLFGCVAILLEVIGWVLLVSALLSNALTAALLTLACVLLVSPVLRWEFGFSPRDIANGAALRLLLALATTVVSRLILVAGTPRGWRVERRERIRGTPAHGPARSLAWETARQGGTLWLWLAMLSLGSTGFSWLAYQASPSQDSFIVLVVVALVGGLAAGVSVFGGANRGGERRFLAQHGVRPGVVWGVKVGLWSIFLAMFWLPQALIPASSGSAQTPRVFAAAILTTATIGLLCGMTIRRGITSWVVAAVASFAVMAGQSPLLFTQMIPGQGLLMIPPALHVVSWAWSGDWLLDSPGLARWGRLALLLSLAFVTTFATYVGYRAWGIPDVGAKQSVSQARTGVEGTLPPGGVNAADLYNAAVREMGGNPAEALVLVRRAASLPWCEFERLDRLTWFSPPTFPWFDHLGNLLADSARARQSRGDLAGAWKDLSRLFLMARHRTLGARSIEAFEGLAFERRALGLAMEWAADVHQTPASLRAALDEYRGLPPLASAAETIQADAVVADRTLRLSWTELSEGLDANGKPDAQSARAWDHTWNTLITAPWEVHRARRAFRLVLAANIEFALTEPGRRPELTTRSGQVAAKELDWAIRTTPLVARHVETANSLVDYCDHNEVARRALIQILALRIWQVKHDGRLPDQLAELVPSELASLPQDPYSGRPFGYVRASGQPIPPSSDLFGSRVSEFGKTGDVTAGDRLLYSVGRDRTDGAAVREESINSSTGDIIFPLADRPGEPKKDAPPSPPGESADTLMRSMIQGSDDR